MPDFYILYPFDYIFSAIFFIHKNFINILRFFLIRAHKKTHPANESAG